MRLLVGINVLVTGAMFVSFFYVPSLADDLKMAPALLSYVTTIGALSALLISYLAGWGSDRWGRRLFFRVGFLCCACAFLGFACAESVLIFVVSRIILGIGWGLFLGTFAAYTSDSGYSLGRFAALGSLGATIGLVICAFGTQKFGTGFALYLGMSAHMLAFGLSFCLPDVTIKRSKRSVWPYQLIKANGMVYLCVLLRHAGAASMWAVWTYYLKALGAELMDIGLINSVNTCVQFLFAYYLLDHFNNSKAFSWGLLVSAIGFVMFAFAKSYVDLYPSQIILGVSWALFYAGALKVLEENNPKEKGAAIGLLGSFMQLSFIVGPLLTVYLMPGMKSDLDQGVAFTEQYADEFIARFHLVIYSATVLSLLAWILSLFSIKKKSSAVVDPIDAV